MTAAVAERQELQIVEQMRPAPANVPAAAPSQSAIQLMTMIEKAVVSGNIDLVGKLMDYQERWEKSEAVKAFNNALADAKARIKPIVKNRTVQFEAKNGGHDVDYDHEDLAGISDAIDEILSECGLFYRWRTVNDFNSGMVAVTCILSHRLGHSEENTLSAKVDAGAGKNHLQAIASAVTYLERYTLKAGVGLAAKNDDDGRAAGGMVILPDPGRTTQQREAAPPAPPAPKITAAQAADLKARFDKAKKAGADETQFWRFAQAEKFEDIAADRLLTINSALKSRYGV